MKRSFRGLLMALWMVGTLSVSAQTNLAGRTYHHPNIMAGVSSEKGTYIVKDSLVIMTDKDNEKDTLFLSKDGKYLSGRMDKKTSFKLQRIK